MIHGMRAKAFGRAQDDQGPREVVNQKEVIRVEPASPTLYDDVLSRMPARSGSA